MLKLLLKKQTTNWYVRLYRGRHVYYMTEARSPFRQARRRVFTDLATAQTAVLQSVYSALSPTAARCFHSSLL